VDELEVTRLAREGRIERRDAPIGEHLLRLPVEDFLALIKLFPDLNSPDPVESSKAMDRFFNSPLAEKYRIARTATQVKRAPRIIPIVRAP
jgi:hypothetical protein